MAHFNAELRTYLICDVLIESGAFGVHSQASDRIEALLNLANKTERSAAFLLVFGIMNSDRTGGPNLVVVQFAEVRCEDQLPEGSLVEICNREFVMEKCNRDSV